MFLNTNKNYEFIFCRFSRELNCKRCQWQKERSDFWTESDPFSQKENLCGFQSSQCSKEKKVGSKCNPQLIGSRLLQKQNNASLESVWNLICFHHDCTFSLRDAKENSKPFVLVRIDGNKMGGFVIKRHLSSLKVEHSCCFYYTLRTLRLYSNGSNRSQLLSS